MLVKSSSFLIENYSFNPNLTYSPGICINYYSTTRSWCHIMWYFLVRYPSSNFPVTGVHSQFKALSEPLLILWGMMRDFSERLKLWVYPLTTYAFNMNYFHSYSKNLHPNLNLDSQYWGWLLPTLILPPIIASATPDNPTGAGQYDTSSTSKLSFAVSSAGISAHNIIQHNRDIYMPTSLII